MSFTRTLSDICTNGGGFCFHSNCKTRKTWIIFDGDYQGRWHFMQNKMHWNPLDMFDYLGAQELRQDESEVTNPIHIVTKTLGFKSWGAVMRDPNAALYRHYAWLYQQALENSKTKKLLEELKEKGFTIISKSAIVVLNFQGRAGLDWLLANGRHPAYQWITNTGNTLRLVLNSGWRSRKHCAKLMVKGLKDKAILRRLKPGTPAQIRNNLLKMSAHGRNAAIGLRVREPMSQDSLTVYIQMVSRDPALVGSHPHLQYYGRKGLLQEYRDTVRMHRRRGLCERPEWTQQRLTRTQLMAIHDRLVEENNRVVEIRQQRYKEIADNRNKKLAEARTKYEAKIEAMKQMQWPEGCELIGSELRSWEEGQEMHHCIGGYWNNCINNLMYDGRMETLWHLRRADGEKASLHATRGKIHQLQGPCNKAVSAEMRQLAALLVNMLPE